MYPLLHHHACSGSMNGSDLFGRSKYRGLGWDKNYSKKPWKIQLYTRKGPKTGSSQVYIGNFASEEAAAVAYDAAAFQLRGAAAVLNFPETYFTPGKGEYL